MEHNKPDLQDEISRAINRETRAAWRSWLITIICFLAGSIWIFYSFYEVRTLKGQSAELNRTISEQRKTLDSLQDVRNRIENSIKEREGLANTLESVTGKRRSAVTLALQLQAQKYKFVWGGRKPEQGGFDQSGFIDYILSQPQIGIIDPKRVPNCNFQCLLNYPGFVKTSYLSELNAGDLIFYSEWNLTMLYLTGNKCIGMMYSDNANGEEIQIKDVNFGPNPTFAKLPYPD
jgi:hypothetical protein